MGLFEFTRTAPLTPPQVFEVLGDLGAYGRWIPLTRIDADPGPVGTGWGFVARSGIGPLTLPDRMRVTRWEPDAGYSIRKLGPILDGWAEVDLHPEGGHTRVVWREDITVRPRVLGRPLGRVTDPANAWMFGRAVDRMLAEACRRHGVGDPDGA